LSPHSSLGLLADFGVLLCAVALIYLKKQRTRWWVYQPNSM
jgi:hypothetical protein